VVKKKMLSIISPTRDTSDEKSCEETVKRKKVTESVET